MACYIKERNCKTHAYTVLCYIYQCTLQNSATQCYTVGAKRVYVLYFVVLLYDNNGTPKNYAKFAVRLSYNATNTCDSLVRNLHASHEYMQRC